MQNSKPNEERRSSSEMGRLLALADYGLDYSGLQDELASLTNLATKITGARISMINLIDYFTQWAVARTGYDIEQMPREDSVCQYTIEGDGALEIADLSADERSKDKNYVTQEGGLRYYYGIPLETSTGEKLGAFCVLDTETKQISPEAAEQLRLLADEVMERLDLMREVHQLQRSNQAGINKQRSTCHDIRSPLSGVVGLAEIASDQLKEEGNAEVAEMVGMMGDSTKAVMDFAEKLLNEEGSDGGGEKRRYGSCGLDDVKESINHMFVPQAKAKGVSLEIDVTDGDKKLMMSRNQLVQVVGNLISNAIKFTPQNGRVSVQLGINPEENARVIFISVSDTGIGMSQEACDRVLNMDADSREGTGGEMGHGLGLKFVQKLVGNMGGDFKIDTKEGEGCRVRIDLPAA